MVNFPKLRKNLKQYEEHREALVRKSRDIIRASKLLIYAVHRDELPEAEKLLQQMDEERKAIQAIARHDSRLVCEGSYKVAMQEYVEAHLYFSFVKTGKLVQLPVLAEHFVLGLADLTGEMVRRAVFLAGKGKVDKVMKIRDEIDQIYGELLKCDIRENEMRRKVDGIKYDLRKLEDLVLDIQLRGRMRESEGSSERDGE
ncbi:MAG TPA: hypothetical protein VJC21_05890 [Candidatus Nanoarchaeia archaeon]|nr:hypothetical protein [Candidatus Nanoarchaeia archaeon]